MELEFLTPTGVWEDFNPSAVTLENSIISAETADNLVCSKQYFTAEENEYGRIRAYIEIYYDARWTDKRAALLVLPSYDRRTDRNFIRTLVKEGYVVGLLDYCGKITDSENKTSFPQNLAYASYPECKKHLDKIEDSARNTPWFVWSKIARRAINVLEQQPIADKTHIGLLGINIGAQVAWQVAGMDSRIRAFVAIGGGGYRWAKNKPRFIDGNVPSSEEESAYSTGVGAETYAKLIRCPAMFIVSRMANFTDVDRAGDILSLVQSDVKHLIITSGTDYQITVSSLTTMINWLRENFILNGANSVNPTAVFENIDGKLYLRINTVLKASRIKVFVCYGEPRSTARHWDALDDLQKVDTHVYTVSVPVYDPDELITAYANFTYKEDNTASSPIQGVIPSKLGISDVDLQRECYHIIYDGTMGLGSFGCLTKDAVLDENSLTQAVGPFDIKGITVTRGGLYLCRSAAEIKALDRTSTLHFDAYSPTEREFAIRMYTYPEMKSYTAYATLKGGEFWQKILLQSADFKSDEGRTLAQFSDTKILAVTDAEGIILNNFLWI